MPWPPRSILNHVGEHLAHRLSLPEGGAEALVVIGHGVTGRHDRPYLDQLAGSLLSQGIGALQVSFAGNGDSQGRFEECTISKEVMELGSILDQFSGYRLGYAGHSMGAAVGVLRARFDRRIAALCSLAGMVHVHDFMQRTFGKQSAGDPMLGKEACPLSPSLLHDAELIGDTLEAARAITIPWLLIHGTQDELVPISDSEAVLALNPRAELVRIPEADHRFSGQVTAMAAAAARFFAGALGG